MDNKEKLKQKLSKKYFSDIANKYDSARNSDFREVELQKDEFKIISDFMQNSKPGKVLDVACGTGAYLHLYKGREIHGVDISKDMLNYAKLKNPNANLKVANAESLPYKDGTFAVVTSARFICHTPEYKKIIREMVRVTSSGGSIILDFPNKYCISAITTKIRLMLGKLSYYNLISLSEIENIAKNNGLKIVEINSKVFLPPKILPKFCYPLIRYLNNKLSSVTNAFCTPLYVHFVKK
ncbi:MAG: class I SAM-dependent methyltransferase [Candidatus Pacearchaeota archaeon]